MCRCVPHINKRHTQVCTLIFYVDIQYFTFSNRLSLTSLNAGHAVTHAWFLNNSHHFPDRPNPDHTIPFYRLSEHSLAEALLCRTHSWNKVVRKQCWKPCTRPLQCSAAASQQWNPLWDMQHQHTAHRSSLCLGMHQESTNQLGPSD